MSDLGEPELHLLHAAASDPAGVVRLCYKNGRKPVEGAREALALADRLTASWLLRYEGNEGVRDVPPRLACALYSLTAYGRAVLDNRAGTLALDPDDLAHPGCG